MNGTAQTLHGELLNLEAIAHELRHESHNLLHHPQLLWQQLHNRLQWLEGSELLTERFVSQLEREVESRRSSERDGWLRLLTRFRESRALVRTLPGHEGLVSGCAFSPDGKLIVSSSWDNTLKVWQSETGREIRTLHGHKDQVTSCDVSPDGRLIASSSYDKTIILWRVDRLEKVRVLTGHEGMVNGCAFSPDGRVLASVGEDRTTRLWDVNTGGELKVARGLSHPSITFSPDGRQLLLGSKLWTSTLSQKLKDFDDGRGYAGSAVFSPDGQLVATSDPRGTVVVWDSVSGALITTLSGHRDPVNACAFSPDGEFLLSAAGARIRERESGLILWKTGTWEELGHLQGHSGGVEFCAFSPEGDVVASASADGSLKFWRTALVNPPSEEEIPDFAYKGCFSPAAESLLCGYRNDGLILRDVVTGEVRGSFTGHHSGVYDCVFSPQGDRVLSASADDTMRLWDSETMQTIHALVGEDAPEFEHFHSCTFSPDGDLVAAVLRYAGAHRLHIWRAATGEELMNGDANGEPESFTPDFPCRFSPDGELFVTGSNACMILRDPNTGEDIIDNMGGCSGAYAFSPDGVLLAQADLEGQVEVFMVNDLLEGDWEEIVLEGNGHVVESCTFSPDGGLLASGDRGGILRVWNVRSRETVWSTRAHSGSVSACEFSPDGGLLMSAGDDHGVRIWRATRPFEEGAFFCLGAATRAEFSQSGSHLCLTDSGGNLYLLELRDFR